MWILNIKLYIGLDLLFFIVIISFSSSLFLILIKINGTIILLLALLQRFCSISNNLILQDFFRSVFKVVAQLLRVVLFYFSFK